MHIIYWAHSYREQDAAVNRHFGLLIEEAAHLIVNFDPPSENVNAAKLEQNLHSCDGMVAVLTWRPSGPSPYILYEIGIALRARKPVLVFLDDRLPDSTIPPRVLQRRFSHRTYFRQVRDHAYALNDLKAYMGEQPGPRYQAGSGQRTCALLGLRSVKRSLRDDIEEFVTTRGYRTVELEQISLHNPLAFQASEHIVNIDVALHLVDSSAGPCQYWAGALHAVSVPSITFTFNASYQFDDKLPLEFQPRLAAEDGDSALQTVINAEFNLFEQDFLNVQDPDAIERYTRMQVAAGFLKGHYEPETRGKFTEVIMGDKYNVSGQAGAVGRNAHAHDMTFTQVSGDAQKIDLAQLAQQLAYLHSVMEREATKAEEKMATGAIAAAEQSARENTAPKVFEYLKMSGKWALGVAEKIGVALAAQAIKEALKG